MSSRREQILCAASELAAEHGVTAMSVRAVAARAGIGASTLRHYFPTQQDLFHAVVGHSLHPHVDDRDIENTAIPPAERLTGCMLQFLPADDSQVYLLNGWFGLYASAVGPGRTAEGARLLDSLTAHARDRVEAWLTTLAGEGAVAGGEMRRHANTLLALVDGLSLAILQGGELGVDEAHAILRDVIRGLVVAG